MLRFFFRRYFIVPLFAFLLSPHLVFSLDLQFNQDSQVFSNPERGWYSYAPMLGSSDYAALANSGVRLVYAAITLADFINQDINSATMNRIQKRFDEMRTAGIKAVLRVNYNEHQTGSDANFAQMQRHMQQLAPVLEANKDVIAYIEAGYFGQWGEWHDWCGGGTNASYTDDHCSKHPDNVSTWSQVLNSLLENTPNDRFVMIRYPHKKQAVFGSEPVTQNDVAQASLKARVGHHNDCFLASSNDVGTYSGNVDSLKNYLQAETLHVPIGGETCSPQAGSRFSCDMAVQEMASLQWVYLNQDYYAGAISTWTSQGCKTEIDQRLGYRLELKSATLPNQIVAGASQKITLTMNNAGFAKPHYSRTVYLRLFSGNNILANIPLQDVDIRSLEPGKETEFIATADIPANLIAESVSMALWLPDEDQRNWNNSRFSIRLAYAQSDEIWQSIESAGHNVLAHEVPVVAGGSRPKAPESLVIN